MKTLTKAAAWYRDSVLYQVYPRSFQDSNGDGVGDLPGVISRLDHLAWLGVDAIWLSPVNTSPNRDYGYDVADFYDIDPSLGTLADLDELIAQGSERGISVLLDLVPNHTSDQHEWFRQACLGRDNPFRDWYVWADAAPDGGVPNNWRSHFGGPAWTWHEPTEQYYLHNFLPEQPDLNWWNPAVREEFDRVLSFWLDRGVAGFRIDVCHGIIKDRELRDDDPFPPEAGMPAGELQRNHSLNRPEVHEILRHWRELADTYDPPAVLIGETWSPDLGALAQFYGSGTDELDLAFNFHFTMAQMDAPRLAHVVAATEAAIPDDAWPVWTLSNHDISRFPTRWAGGDVRKVRAGMLTLLAMRGTPVLYYGDELGMVDGEVSRAHICDPVGFADLPEKPGRDPERTPMQWTPAADGGFTEPGTTPWLPMANPAGCNVSDQRDDAASTLRFCRALLALRRESRDLRSGDYRQVEAPEAVWAFQRGTATTVAVNMSDTPASVDGVRGRVALSSVAGRVGDGEIDGEIDGVLMLAPWEGVIVTAREI